MTASVTDIEEARHRRQRYTNRDEFDRTQMAELLRTMEKNYQDLADAYPDTEEPHDEQPAPRLRRVAALQPDHPTDAQARPAAADPGDHLPRPPRGRQDRSRPAEPRRHRARPGDVIGNTLLVIVLGLTLVALLAGCSTAPEIRTVVKTQTIQVPVTVKPQPPAELAAPYRPTVLPHFVAPGDPQASSALTPQGEDILRAIITEYIARDAAWRAWSSTTTEEGTHESEVLNR